MFSIKVENMLKLSDKATILPASPIRKLVPYAESAKKRGVKVYHLNIGQPDIETPQCALEAIHNMDARVLEYTHSAGNASYREALADFYSARGREVKMSQIMVTNGGSEAVLFGLMALCNEGDEVIVPEPFYANYNSFAIEAGVKIVPITAKIENGFALPSIGEFEKLINERTKAIMICNPNNPTGYLYTKEEIDQLKEIVVKYDLYLLSDEVYSDFCYDGEVHHSVLNLEDVDDRVILLDSVSKRYSMCGARVGTLISRNEKIIDAVLRMAQARLCAPFVGQIAGEAATRFTPKSYFEDVYHEYIERRDVMVGALQKMDGVVCPMPKGAFYAIAGLPIDDADKFAQWLLEEFQYKGATVMMAPASGFYSNPKTCPQNEVRLAYVLKKEDLVAAMEVLKEALKVYNCK